MKNLILLAIFAAPLGACSYRVDKAPDKPTSALQNTLSFSWISAGAPQNSSDAPPEDSPKAAPPSTPLPPPGLNFESISARVFHSLHCTECHNTFDTFGSTIPLIMEISFRTHSFGTAE
jgi:hypothetical protein